MDWQELCVPNWITFPMVLSGLVYNLIAGGWNSGLAGALLGTVVGLATLFWLWMLAAWEPSPCSCTTAY